MQFMTISLKKSMDLVRDGGVVAFITSTWTMNKKSTQFRNELNGIASFVGGVRLPNDAFKHIAGTDVATDILFFQERANMHTLLTIGLILHQSLILVVVY